MSIRPQSKAFYTLPTKAVSTRWWKAEGKILIYYITRLDDEGREFLRLLPLLDLCNNKSSCITNKSPRRIRGDIASPRTGKQASDYSYQVGNNVQVAMCMTTVVFKTM
jgi:hypothetical protein